MNSWIVYAQKTTIHETTRNNTKRYEIMRDDKAILRIGASVHRRLFESRKKIYLVSASRSASAGQSLEIPSGVAAQLGSFWMIILAWSLGGLYCLLGANYLTELATMISKAGGFYVYAERAFGRHGGFVVGWSDWLKQTFGPFLYQRRFRRIRCQ